MKEEDKDNQQDSRDNTIDAQETDKQKTADQPEETAGNSSKEENNTGSEKTAQPDNKSTWGEEPPAENRFLRLIKQHKAATFFAFLLIIGIVWLLVLMNNHKKQYQKDKSLLMQQHAAQIDSMRVSHLEFSSRVFSWSVRSELIRNNTENLNQLFTVFVQESEASLVQLITPEGEGDGMKIAISTDKQFEGRRFDAPNIPGFTKQHILEDETGVTIYTPVMEFNRAIGVLLVRLRR